MLQQDKVAKKKKDRQQDNRRRMRYQKKINKNVMTALREENINACEKPKKELSAMQRKIKVGWMV